MIKVDELEAAIDIARGELNLPDVRLQVRLVPWVGAYGNRGDVIKLSDCYVIRLATTSSEPD